MFNFCEHFARVIVYPPRFHLNFLLPAAWYACQYVLAQKVKLVKRKIAQKEDRLMRYVNYFLLQIKNICTQVIVELDP